MMHIHPDPKRILILGDGDAGGVRELLKYSNISSIDWVEIDKLVYETCKRYLPGCPPDLLEDNRISPHWIDGIKFLKNTSNRYDIVFVSVTEFCKNNVCESLYNDKAANLFINVLNTNGICVQSAGFASPRCKSSLSATMRNFKSVFPFTSLYTIGLPAFGIDWGFCVGSKTHIPSEPSKIRIDQLEFYDKLCHSKMFHIPNWISRILQ